MAKKNGSTKEQRKAVLDVPVEFGGVAIGDATARLGIRIDRSVLNIISADETFCGHRLSGRIILGGEDEQPGQMSFLDDVYDYVEGTFDVKRISVNTKAISTGLTFSLNDIDIETLAKFSRGSGRLLVEHVAELPEATGDDDDESEAEPMKPSKGPWAEVLLSTLFKDSLLKSLNKAGLTTVGQLADYSSRENARLTDLEGIGPGKAEKIEETMIRFWEANPDAGQTQTAGAGA